MTILKVGKYWVLYCGDQAVMQFDSIERAMAVMS
jgi:hypothetical protein